MTKYEDEEGIKLNCPCCGSEFKLVIPNLEETIQKVINKRGGAE